LKKISISYVVSYIDDKLESIFSYFCSRYRLFTVLCFFLMVGLMIFSTPFTVDLAWDGRAYLLKGFEITEGNWIPIHSHSIGWSIVLAFFLKVFAINSVFDGMLLSRILSLLIMGSSIFLFSRLADKLNDKKSAAVAVLAFALSPQLMRVGGLGVTEPLFILLLLWTVYFLADSEIKRRNIVIATILASLSYYIRPNGIWILGVIVLNLTFLLYKRKIGWLFLLLVPLLFFLVSFPHLFLRYESYGSAFHYGFNSMFFVDKDEYVQGASNLAATPSAVDYIRTHDIGDYYHKFVYAGLFKLAKTFYDLLGGTWFLLFFLGTIKYLFVDRHFKFNAVFIALLVFLTCLIVVFDNFGAPKHLYPLLPFIFILSSKFLIDLLETSSRNNILVLSFILLLLLQAPVLSIRRGINIAPPEVRDEWAIWAADNLKGKIAIVDGHNLIDLIVINNRIGSKNLLDLSTGNPYMSTFEPRKYGDLEDAMQDFKKIGVSYLMLDREYIKRRRYLYEVYDSKWSRNFVLIRSFRSKPEDKWIIKDMDIFKIVY